jgi:hypothetical protein
MSNQHHRFLTPKDVQAEYGIAVQTLANWRSTGRGPKFIRVGKLIRYERDVFERYLKDHTVHTMDSIKDL